MAVMGSGIGAFVCLSVCLLATDNVALAVSMETLVHQDGDQKQEADILGNPGDSVLRPPAARRWYGRLGPDGATLQSILVDLLGRGVSPGSDESTDDDNFRVPSLLLPAISNAFPEYRDNLKTSSQLAYFRPLLCPEPVTISEPGLAPYQVLVFLSTAPEGWKVVGARKRVFYATYDVSPPEGQTWQTRTALQRRRPLPTVCGSHSDDLLPALAFSAAQQAVYLFGFGVHPSCAVLQRWKVGDDDGFREVSSSGGQHVPHLFHTLLAVDSPKDNSTTLLLSFGGLPNECLPSLNRSACKSYSSDMWSLVVSVDNSTSNRNWSPVYYAENNTIPSGRLAPIAVAVDDDNLLMYGGVGRQEGSPTDARVKYWRDVPMCDLWLYQLSSREWRQLDGLQRICNTRKRNPCERETPMRPLASYDRRERLLTVVSLFSSSVSVSQCFIDRIQVATFSWMRKEWVLKDFQHNVQKNIMVFGKFGEARKRQEFLAWNGRKILTSVFRLQSAEIVVSKANERSGFGTVDWRYLTGGEVEVFRFVGNFGCMSPPVVRAKDDTFVFLGGFCTSTDHIYKGHHIPNWKVMPVWYYSSKPGFYTMRIVKPGPPFLQRSLYSVVKLESKGGTTAAGHSKAVMFGGVSLTGHPLPAEIWCFDLRSGYWQQGVERNRTNSPGAQGQPLAGHVAFSMASTKYPTFIVYGGADLGSPFLSNSHKLSAFEFDDLGECRGRWRSISSIVEPTNRTLPSLVLHSVTTFEDQIYVFGGYPIFRGIKDMPCGSFFRLDVDVTGDQGRASCEPITGTPHHLRTLMGHSLTPYSSDSLLLLGGCSQPHCLSKTRRAQIAYLLKFNDRKHRSAVTAITFFTHTPILFPRVEGNGVFGSVLNTVSLRFYGRLNPEFKPASSYMCFNELVTKACPVGYGYLGNGKTELECEPCPNGTFSDTTSTNCTLCPRFTRPLSSRIGCEAINPCESSPCHHGTCIPGIGQFTCHCSSGYVAYDHCQIPWVNIGASCGSALAIYVALGIITGIYRRMRRESRRKDEQIQDRDVTICDYRKTLEELAKSRYIRSDELDLQDPVSATRLAVSSQSEIWKAKLGDMVVAVKQLRGKHSTSRQRKERFYEEAEELRRVRHRNIVMFLGAGPEQGQERQRPFIVLEYMARGSLHSILSNPAVKLELANVVDFALDAARGMKFLHGLDPARIHCNLKTPNLLVTEKWVVKVADFGMAALLSRYGEQDGHAAAHRGSVQAAGSLFRALSESAPLLSPTAAPEYPAYPNRAPGNRWSSPETLVDGIFNCKTDVYSFGVVLWEMYTRLTPYQGIEDFDDISSLIKLGQRPELPAAMPLTYRELVEKCWHSVVGERPTFPGVVRCLKRMQKEITRSVEEAVEL
eukprot:scpid28047/ scgid22401/ Probable serine/threonine-protein kinase drkC; Receptor-like kinase 3; Receptor-like kinase C; Vesicle-associated receptor tyrosine kinase-like protein 3